MPVTHYKPVWRPDLNYSDALARMMLRDPKDALLQLKSILSGLAHIPNFKSGAETLLEMLKGMWVNPEAAATLSCCIKELSKPYLINALEAPDFTGPSYLRRAWAYPQKFKIVAAGSCRTQSEISKVLLDTFSRLKPRMAEIRLKAYKDPLVLLFSPPESTEMTINPYPDQDLLKKIQHDYPNVTILIATGESIPSELKIFATPIEPLLKAGEEDKQYICFDEVRELIETQMAD